MTELHCSTCGIELMSHEAGSCLNTWVAKVILAMDPNYCSWEIEEAYTLMEQVWELDPYAGIYRERIEIENVPGADDPIMFITGPTFPLRVCRAAIFLAARKGEKA